MHRLLWLMCGVLGSLVVAACALGQPVVPTPEVFTALYVVRDGPYPLYADDGDWLATRAAGLLATDAQRQTIDAARIARAQHRVRPEDGPSLLTGCIFDVHSTTPDQREPNYLWAFGRVVRCAEPIEDGVVEPQMGTRPQKLRVYDGYLGYFPMSLLDPYLGTVVAQRQ
jgi:hypothetical protein